MIVDILYSSSDSYAFLTGISIVSLCENNKDCKTLHIWIMDNQISKINKEKLIWVAKKYQRELTFVPMPDIEKLTGRKINTGRWNISTFGRLFIASVLPNNIGKVLNIDCDTIIVDSLKELYETNLSGKVCAGILECWDKYSKANIGLKKRDKYINGGIVYFNLNEIRKNEYEKKFAKYIAQYGDSLPYLDQEVLNAVVPQDKIHILPIRYNMESIYYYASFAELMKLRRPPIFYDQNELEMAKNNPAIIHFTTCFLDGLRPWIEGNHHPYLEDFFKYKKLSPWINVPLQKAPKSGFARLEKSLIKNMPRKFLCEIAGIMHGVICPHINRVKMWKYNRFY